MWRPLRVSLCLVAFAAGCGDAGPLLLDPADLHEASHASGSPADALRSVAAIIQAGLADPGGQQVARAAMTASPWAEQKLVLQEFFETAPGRAFLAGALRRSGASDATLDALLAELPPLDFYLPFEGQRRTWRGDVALGVLHTMDPDQERIGGFDAAGAEIWRSRGVGEHSELFALLHPAETKIQAQGLGSFMVSPEARLDAASAEASNLMVDVYTRLDHWKVLYDTEWGDEEPLFRAEFYDPAGKFITAATYVSSTAGGTSHFNVNHAYFSHRIPAGSPGYVEVEAWEDDPNYNDFMGRENVTVSENLSIQNTYQGGVHRTQFRLKWEAAPAQDLTGLTVPSTLTIPLGATVEVGIKPYDQNGYGFASGAVTPALLSDNTAIADRPSPNTYSFSQGTIYIEIEGLGAGSTTLRASAWIGSDVVANTIWVTVEDNSGGSGGCGQEVLC